MPGTRVEGTVEIGDQPVLGEVDLHLSEKLRADDAPQLTTRDAVDGWGLRSFRGG